MLVVVLSALLLCLFAPVAGAKNVVPKENIFAERPLVHILGPSPAITITAERSAVDSMKLESADIFKDIDTYYWYYHAQSKDKERWPGGYRLCVATAKNPLGPWKKHEGNPILDVGEKGAWDDRSVYCAMIMKEGAYNISSKEATYYMWYGAKGPTGSHVGLATADNPLGPWKKHEGNPVLTWEEEGGVYPGSVCKVDGKFYMFMQPVGLQDHGPFCLATASKPEGPWEMYKDNPVLTPGDWGAWDDGGFSEACIRYHEGVFHLVFGGWKAPKTETLGYAWSFDGINWHKYQANPVVPLSRVPDGSYLGEVHCWVEGPYIYVFHTLRYFTGEGTALGISSYPRPEGPEDLAVQVLTIDPRFKISFPVLMMDSLDAGQSSRIAACLPIGLEAASSLAVSTECTYDDDAKAGLRVHVRASEDGVHCDTDDLYTFYIPFRAGQTVKKTFVMNAETKFAKVVVENLDRSNAAKSVNVTVTVGN